MTKKKRWRYYCDFCKKSGCSGFHMARHEKRCTANPNRECGLCGAAGYSTEPTSKLVAALGNGDKAGMGRLRDLTEGCPACILTAIRQSGLQRAWADRNDVGAALPDEAAFCEFSFKKERDEFWSMIARSEISIDGSVMMQETMESTQMETV